MNVAVMKTKAEQTLSEAFETAAPKLPGGEAVMKARRAAMARFAATGLPHRRIEEWKYTDLRVNLKEAFAPAVENDAAGKTTVGELIVALGPLAHLDVHRIAFVNGHCCANLSDLGDAKGIVVKPLAGALAAAPDDVVKALIATAGPENDATVALNTAYVTDGAVVQVAPGATLDKPLLIVFVRAGKEPLAANVRNAITLGHGSKATILEAHVSVPGSTPDALVNALSHVSVGDGADLAHIKVAAGPGKAVHLANWTIGLGKDAMYRGFQFTTGQGLTRNQIFATYKGEGGKLDLSGAYLARGAEHVDTTLVVDHAVPHCESRELFKGVLDGHARGVFQGKIIVQPDAQKTNGKQMAQVLMLSPDAEFDSKPELEIFADDVVCGHGTTSMELDEDLLFYCKSRGIPDNEARALLIESFIGEAIEKVDNEAIRTALMAYAVDWLKAGNV